MLFILAEKHKQEEAYAKALKGHFHHVNRYIDEVDNSKTRPDFPKIQLSYLQGHAYELIDAKDYNKKWASWALKYLPIFPKVFKHRLSQSFIKFSGGKQHMKAMNEAIGKCDKLWLGSDPDFEGEGLIYEAVDINHWNNKVAGRIWITHGLTVSGLIKTFHHDIKDPEETKPRGTASHAREAADWLIGINISRLITDIARKYGYKGAFTAGRVQTPTLALIAARRVQRVNFKPTTSYRLAFYDKNNLNFLGSTKDAKGKRQKAVFKTKDDANKAIQNIPVVPTIISAQNQTRHQSAPKLPKTNNMQGYLVKHAHITAKQAANKVLEPMYDRYSAQTYPRTECNLITVDDFNALKRKLPQYRKLYGQIIGKDLPSGLFTNLKPRRKYVDFTGKKVQKQGHGAITPDPENKVMSYAQYKKLPFADRVDYKHVLGCTLAMFADDHAYSELKIDAKSGNYFFTANQRTDLPNKTDWKQLFPWMSKGSNNKAVNPREYVKGGQLVPNAKYKLSKGYYPKSQTTTAPPAITESNLVGTVMPKYNLGTSSTRASIIDSLKHTKLINSAKKKDTSKRLVKGEFMPTDKGIVLLELMRYSHLLNLAKVSSWENQMKEIADKKLSYSKFLDNIKANISDDIQKMPNHQYKFSIKPHKSPYKDIKQTKTDIGCPKCKKGKIVRLDMDHLNKQKNYDHISFYVCSNNKCRFYAPTSWSSLSITPDVLKQIMSGGYPKDDYHTFEKKDKSGTFKARLTYKQGKIKPIWPKRKQNFVKTFDLKCPKCKKGKIGLVKSTVKGGKNKGKQYEAYRCTNDCGFNAWTQMAGLKITPALLKQIFNGTMKEHTFKSRKRYKRGKNKGKHITYQAKIKYSNGGISMDFNDNK